MPTLIAIGYPDEGTAEYAQIEVSKLESELVIQADQVAVITRSEGGNYHVHTTHGDGGSIFGGLWGQMLERESAEDIDQAFQRQVREHLEPGTSALLMVVEQMAEDKAIEALRGYGGTVIKTSLSDTDTKRMQDELHPSSSPSGAPS